MTNGRLGRTQLEPKNCSLEPRSGTDVASFKVECDGQSSKLSQLELKATKQTIATNSEIKKISSRKQRHFKTCLQFLFCQFDCTHVKQNTFLSYLR